MTRAMEQGIDAPARVLRLPRSAGPHRAGAEHDLCAGGRRELSPTDPARRARRRLDRVEVDAWIRDQIAASRGSAE